MPQILGLPIDEPVAQPYAKPQTFGTGGETVTNLGLETEQMAQGVAQFEGYLASAQRQLNAKEAQIAFERQKAQVYTDLQKATTPQDAQAIYDHSKGTLDNVLAPFQGDKVLARQLGIYRQQEDVEIQSTVNAKKAEIVTHADKAANQVLGDKAMQQGIADAVGGGDPSIARKQYELQLQSSVAHGTLLPDQAAAELATWDQHLQIGVVEAYANNPDPAKRQQLIAQLKNGGKGPIDLSALDQGEINRLYTHAVDTDHNLSYKEEAQHLTTALNVVHDAFQTPQYKNNFDQQIKALDDSEWLKQHGIVTADSEPDRILADKIRSHVDAAAVDYDRAAKRDADQKRDEVYDRFAKGDIAGGMDLARQYLPIFQAAKVDYYPQIISQSRSWMAEQRAEARANHEIHTQDAQAKRQQAQDDSFATLGQIQIDIQQGKRYSDTELYGMVGQGKGKLLTSQVGEAIRMAHSFESDPANKPFYSAIWNQQFQPHVMGELISEFDDYIRKNPQATSVDKAAKVKELTDGKNIERINDGIDSIEQRLNGNAPAKTTVDIPETSGPNVGDTKLYNGANYKFDGTFWNKQ